VGSTNEMRHWFILFFATVGFAVVLLFTATVALASSPPMTADTARAFAVCERATQRWERISKIPSGLLQAISLAESGRWSKADKRVRAWPWTVTSGGPGSYFPTKADAMAEVHRLQAKGVENIDVGCMQVNMQYHGHHFDSVAHAMDPDINVAYAAKFLSELQDAAGSWAEAAGHYHSMTPERTAYYRGKVEKFWATLTGETPSALASIDDPTTGFDIPGAIEHVQKPTIYSIAPIDRARTAALNARFDKLKTVARKLRDDMDPDARRERQLAAWREARSRPEGLQALLAMRKAELAAKREREINPRPEDRAASFKERRLRQLREWRLRVAAEN
jgi:hypothetical protein